MRYKILFICVVTAICLSACGNKNTEKSDEKAASNEEKNKDTTISTGKSDMILVTTMDELRKGSDVVVNAKIVKRTENEAEIEYELKVNEWLKDGKEISQIKLKTINNTKGNHTDVNFYDFKENETYVFFLNYNGEDDCYYIACQNTGLIKVESDNSIHVQENDPIFKDCKSYEDVTKLIKE